MFGECCVRAQAKSQAIIALSSGEAEYYALVSSSAYVLGDAAVAADMGVCVRPEVFMDVTAGIAIGQRRGLGHVRHVDVAFLWVQQVVEQGKITIRKRNTLDMLADVMTKPVTDDRMTTMMARTGYSAREGSHDMTLKAS